MIGVDYITADVILEETIIIFRIMNDPFSTELRMNFLIAENLDAPDIAAFVSKIINSIGKVAVGTEIGDDNALSISIADSRTDNSIRDTRFSVKLDLVELVDGTPVTIFTD